MELVPVEISNAAWRLSELVITGRAFREGSTEALLQACRECERRTFPNPRVLTVDENTWDGSDFLLVDKNPNLILVSQRVHDFFVSPPFRNVEFVAVA